MWGIYGNWIGTELLLNKSTWTFHICRVSDVSVILFQLPCCPWPWKPLKWFLPQSTARPHVANRNWTRATKRDWLEYLQWFWCKQPVIVPWKIPEKVLKSPIQQSLWNGFLWVRTVDVSCMCTQRLGRAWILWSWVNLNFSPQLFIFQSNKNNKTIKITQFWSSLGRFRLQLETDSSSEVPAWPTPIYTDLGCDLVLHPDRFS